MDNLGQNQNPIKFRQFYVNPSFSFKRKKNTFDEYDPNAFIEEEPTFTFENDRNVKSYKGYIQKKSKEIERYSQNYLEYMKKNRFNNMRYRTPLQNNNIQNNFNHNYGININNNYNNNNLNNNINNNYNNLNDNNYNNNNLSNNINNNNLNNNNNMNLIPVSQSYQLSNNYRDDFIMKGRTNEITNPDLFYKQASDDYYNYRQEQKKFLNYNLLTIQNNYFKKKEINVNPYNKGSSSDLLGNTFLKHNPILNPSPSFGYKYFDREKNISELNENSLQNAGNNLIKGN